MLLNLTSGDVCETAGVPMTTLDRWVAAGFVRPDDPFSGHGRHRIYTPTQCLAIVAGARWRAEGAGLERVAWVVRLIATLGIERIEVAIEEGRTLPVPGAILRSDVIPGMMIEPPTAELGDGAAVRMKRLDVAAIYAEVMQKIEGLSKRPANRVGRSRGLTGKLRVCRS